VSESRSWNALVHIIRAVTRGLAFGFLGFLFCGLLDAQPALQPLSDSSFWTFERFRGAGRSTVAGQGNDGVLEMWSEGAEGMAAEYRSVPIPVEPNRKYRVRIEIKTKGLESIDAGLTGAPYVRFWDAQLLPSSYQPSGSLAPADSDWHAVEAIVTTPATARTAEIHLAYAAYGTYVDDLRPRNSGKARGHLWVRDVTIESGEIVAPLPPTIHVSDPAVQQAIDTVFEVLHDSSLLGRFVDSDGYTDSSNIVPDISFGLYGVRRQGYAEYMTTMARQWEELGESSSPDGKIPQRVMSQILFPLGVAEIFSFTGDRGFLTRMLPIADRALEYVIQRGDSEGLVRLVEYGQWRIGEGADWVDWYPTRMEGKTFNFHQWYVWSLRRMAALHEECGRGPDQVPGADVQRAARYRQLADRIEQTLRTKYWAGDHFVTNVDYGGKVADERWLDDHVWAIRLGTANPEQVRAIWSWIDEDPFYYEGVPTRWAAFRDPVHGPLSWFGRLGAGDILARYRTGNSERGIQLLDRISEIFARDRNVYEAYSMWGTIAPGTLGWGNYTEHAGGYLWALTEGPFGIVLESDGEALGTITPRFPETWSHADTTVRVRGTTIQINYDRAAGGSRKLTIRGDGDRQPIRLVLPVRGPRLIQVGSGGSESIEY